MLSRSRILGWPLAATLIASCAAPAELARRSEVALGSGEVERAYVLARRALDGDARNARARAAYDAAARARAEEMRARIVAAAEIDTIGAARQAIEYADFRSEALGHGATIAPDSGFALELRALRAGAAAIFDRLAEDHMMAGHPKTAYLDLRQASTFDAGLPGLRERMNRAHDMAQARVALLPFANQTSLDGLSRVLTDVLHTRLRQEIDPKHFEFTHLMDLEPVYARVPVAALAELPREDAIEIGRDLEATHVIRGRIFGERTSMETRTYHETIYRRRRSRGPKGEWIETFEPREFQATFRRRTVTLSYDLEALDTDDGQPFARRTDVREAVARTVFSDFAPEGDCDDYCLVSPELKKEEPKRAERIETAWKEAFGPWELPDLLEHARDYARQSYGPQPANEFRSARPLFLDELPGERELALVALEDVWHETLEVLEEIERR